MKVGNNKTPETSKVNPSTTPVPKKKDNNPTPKTGIDQKSTGKDVTSKEQRIGSEEPENPTDK